jgi:hypothetical protein
MHDHGKSDRPIVPAMLPNKPGRPEAEVVEGRGLPEGNTTRLARPGLSAGSSVSGSRTVCDRPRGRAALTPLPEGGAQCVRRARWDLRGGPLVTAVPTGAPGMTSSSGVRVPRGGDDTNHKPRATASSRGGVGRKPEAKSRP